MTRAEFKNYHERVAARLRAAASTTTTSGVKSRLLEKAEKHERLAVGEPEQEGNAASLRAAEAMPHPGAVKNFGVQAQIEELRR